MSYQKPTLVALSFSLALLLSGFANAQDNESIIDDLKPVLDNQMIAIATARLDQLESVASVQQLLQNVDGLNDEAKAEVAKRAEFLDGYIEGLIENGATDIVFLCRLGTLLSENYMAVVRCENESAAGKVAEFFNERDDDIFYRNTPRGKLVLLDYYDVIGGRIPRMEAADAEMLRKVLDTVKEAPIRFAGRLSNDQSRALAAGDPAFWGEDSIGIQDFRWLAAGLDVNGKKLRLKLKAANSEAALAITSKIRKALETFTVTFKLNVNPELASWMEELSMVTDKDEIELEFSDKEFDTMAKKLLQTIHHLSDPSVTLSGWWTEPLIPYVVLGGLSQ